LAVFGGVMRVGGSIRVGGLILLVEKYVRPVLVSSTYADDIARNAAAFKRSISMAIPTFTERVNRAIEIVTGEYPEAKLAQAYTTKLSPDSTYLLKLDFHNKNETTVSIQETAAGQFEPPIFINQFLLGSANINWPVAVSLEQAMELKNKAGFDVPDNVFTLRLPVYPGDVHPLYIFGRSVPYVFVDSSDGSVTTGS
jgi:hypothetical protein